MERIGPGGGRSQRTPHRHRQDGPEPAGPVTGDGPAGLVAEHGPAGPVAGDVLAGPVFLDTSGRRRQAMRGLAVLTGCAVLGAITLLAAALLGAPVGPSALFPNGDLIGTTTTATAPRASSTGAPDSPAGITTTTAGTDAPVRAAATPTGGRTASSTHAGVPSTTTTVPPAAITSTTAKNVPPGRPTGLPTPPGHTK